MKEQQVICIVCPRGCHIDVKEEDGEMTFKNQGCKRGPEYVKKELSNPTRMLTTTVEIEGAIVNRMPVVTSSDIPKNMIFECIKELAKVKIKAPVKVGEIICKDILGLGVDILATRTLEKI